jgi:hypothetical protein
MEDFVGIKMLLLSGYQDAEFKTPKSSSFDHGIYVYLKEISVTRNAHGNTSGNPEETNRIILTRTTESKILRG